MVRFILTALLGIHSIAAAQPADLTARVRSVLDRLEAAAQDTFPSLIQELANDAELDCTVAARLLYTKPRPAADAPSLIESLQHDTKARTAAAWELSRIGPAAGEPVVRALLEALQYPEKHERNFVVLALAMDSLPQPALVSPLLRILKDPGSEDPPQRNYKFPQATSAAALGMLGPTAREAVPALTGAVAATNAWEYYRTAAQWALGRIAGSGAADASVNHDVRALARTIAEGSRRTSPKAVDGLRALGAFAGAAKPIRKQGSGKAALAVHESITLAIGYLDSLNPPPSVQQIAREEKEGALSAGVVRYVMALGGVQQGITAALLKSLMEGERDPRVLAARRLGGLGSPAREAIPVLRAAAADSDWIVRREAALALNRLEQPQAKTPPATYVYKTFGDRKLQLAMHYPAGWSSADKRTAILFFSGAHKVQPDREGKLPPLAAERARLKLPIVNNGPGGVHAPFCDALARAGRVVIRVEYRTRGKDGVLPGADIEDAAGAIRWIRDHAGELGIDPRRVVAAGGSSGAYLAAGLFAFEKQVSAQPNAIVMYSPLVDWLEVGSMSDSFLVVLGGDKELGARVSPARHWRKDSPPSLVMVGTEEPPFTTVKEFAEKWRAAGAPMELFVADGGQHGFFAQPAWIAKTVARTEQFLQSLGY
jgi:acetyl esterase